MKDFMASREGKANLSVALRNALAVNIHGVHSATMQLIFVLWRLKLEWFHT